MLEPFELTPFYIISQIFALVGMILSLIAMQKKKKVQILNYTTVSSFCAIFHYLFLGAWSGVAIKITSTTRNGVAAYEAHKNKISKIIPVIFVAFYIVSGILTFKTPFSMLPMISTILFTIIVYLGNAKVIRYVAAVCSALWLIYNVYVFSIVGVLAETLYIINDLIAICRFSKPKKAKKRRTNK